MEASLYTIIVNYGSDGWATKDTYNEVKQSHQLSKPKLNQQLNLTEFDVRLHSYREIHPTPCHKLSVVVVNLPASRQGPVRTTVQSYIYLILF